MKLVWTPDTALKAYVCTVKTCGDFKESSVAELLSAMAAGWNAKLIVESWSKAGPIATSIGLAVAAKHTCGRHVCVVPDEGSRSEYVKAMHGAGMRETEVLVGEAEEVMAGLVAVDFLVVDCRRRDFVRILRFAKLSHKGAVLACKNAFQQPVSGFKWHGVLERGTRVVKTAYLPVGQGLDMAHIGSNGGKGSSKGGPSRWIKHIDRKSELEIAAKAAEELRKEGKAVRVVSFVSWELFDEQSDAYKESVLPAAVEARVSIEAGSTFGWEKIVGDKGKAIGIDRFGASAPAGKIYKEFGITTEAVIAAAKEVS